MMTSLFPTRATLFLDDKLITARVTNKAVVPLASFILRLHRQAA
jgi:hypothetical protein